VTLVSRSLLGFTRKRVDEFPRDVRRVVSIEISAALLVTGFSGLTGPFVGLILRREFGATPLQLSVMASAGAAFMLLSLVWARSLHGRTPLPYVVWPTFISRALFLFVPFITSAWGFVGIHVMTAFLNTVSSPAATALVERVYPHDVRGRALSAIRTAAAVPAIALSLVAGTILAIADFRWIFASAALLGMAASLRQRELPVPERPAPLGRDTTSVADAWATLRRDRDFRRLLLSHFIFGSAIWLQMPAGPLLLADVVRATTTQVGVFAAAAAIAGLIGNACWGRLVDRKSSLWALRLVYCLGVVTALLYCLAWTPWLVLAASVSDSLMTTGLDLVWMLALIEVAGARRTAQYAAIAATLAGVRGVIGPLVGGLVIEHAGLHAVYLLAAALMACAVWVLSLEVRDAERRPVARFTRRLINAVPAR
jgi:predicted MFS family arabinose efflux permease